MSVESILLEAYKSGVFIYVEKNQLAFEAKKGSLTDDIKKKLKANKKAIIEYLLNNQLEQNLSAKNELQLKPRSKSDIIPLSYAQQRLWFIAQLEDSNAAYHISEAMRLRGKLTISALEQAFHSVVMRHEVLRTVFKEKGGEVWQEVLAQSNFTLAQRDLSALSKEEQLATLDTELEQEADAAFDLSNGPLFRGRLLRLSNDKHVLALSMHHIVSDGWSMGILTDEIVTLYRAYNAGEENPLPPLEIQFGDYVIWQRHCVSNEDFVKQEEFWKKHLKSAPSLLELPCDFPRPAVQSYQGESVEILLDKELSEHVKALANAKNLTLHMVFYAALVLVLYRLSAQDKIIVGTPVSNRKKHELEGLIGFFVNTLPICMDLSANPTVENFLEQVLELNLAAYARQELSFDRIVELVHPERSLSFSPIFQVLLDVSHDSVSDNSDVQEADTEGLQWEAIDTNLSVAQYDLTFSLIDSETGISGSLEYASDLYKRETIERWVGYFIQTIKGLVSQRDCPIKNLNILSVEETQQLVHDFNQTSVAYPGQILLHQMFESQVEKNPSALALIYEDCELSYGDLNVRANQLAHYLIELGIKPDTMIGLCMERSLDIMVGILAILKAGGAYVPLDPTYPEARLQYQLDDTGMDILLTQQQLLTKIPVSEQQALCVDNKELQQKINIYSGDNPDSTALGLSSDNLAYVIYSSGTTGKPKGILLNHTGPVNLFFGYKKVLKLDHNSRFLQFASSAFDASVFEWILTLFSGGSLIIPSAEVCRDITQLTTLVNRKLVTHACLPPSLLSTIEKHEWQTIKVLVVAGESCPLQQAKRWSDGRILVNGYGPSECSISSSLMVLDSDIKQVTIGKPIQNCQHYLVDEYLQAVPQGVVGELLIGSVGLARAYLNQHELSNKKFIGNPFSMDSKSRLFRTGDLMRSVGDGNLEFIGRIDHQVKLRGLRIELGEIETQLRDYSSISEAVVILDKISSADQRLIAYMSAANESEVDMECLREHLTTGLPVFMIPSIFIMLPALPLTANGKVDRNALPKVDDTTIMQRKYEAPTGVLERIIADIWQGLLKLKKISRWDNFFELGGHSLLVIKLIAQLQERGLHTNMRAVFDHPGLKDFAASISANTQQQFKAPSNLIPDNCEKITPKLLPLVDLEQQHIDSIVLQIPGHAANIQDIYPLGPLQEGILFHHMLSSPEQGDTYIMPILLKLSNKKQLERFIKAINSVVERHDILRTAMLWQGLPCAVQVVQRKAELLITELQLDPAVDALSQLQERMEPENLWMDLARAPQLPIEIAADPASEQYFAIIQVHHINNDHIGMDLLIEELDAFLESDNPPLPQAVPYREFIAHTLALSESGAMDIYFNSRLGDIEDPTQPFGLDNIRLTARQINEAIMPVEKQLGEKIHALSQRLAISTASIFHLAWALVVGRCSGHDDVVFGTVLSGRLQGTEGADRSLGLFINTLPLRIKLSGTVQNCLKQTHEELLTLLNYEQASLAKVVACTQLPNDVPLFTSLINYRNNRPHAGEEKVSHAERIEDLPGDSINDDEGIETLNDGYERANYPFDISVEDNGGADYSLVVQVEESLDPQTIAGYVHNSVANIVHALESTTDAAMAELDILSVADRQRLLLSFNQSKTLESSSLLIHQQFEMQVQRRSAAIAVEFGLQSLSYRELNRRANQLAYYLLKQGIEPGELIGIYLPRSLDFLMTILAVMKAGGAYVVLDTNNPVERLKQISESAGLRLVISYQAMVAAFFKQRLCLDDAELLALLEQQKTTNPNQAIAAEAPAFAYYTSGSTGTPKGALNSHVGVVNNMLAMANELNLSPADRVLQFAALGFDVVIEEIFPAWFVGATVVLRDEEGLLGSEELQNLLTRRQITVCELMAGYWAHWLDYLKQHHKRPPESLRCLMLGSDRVAISNYQQWQEFGIPVVNVFGLTETACTSLVYHANGPQTYKNYLPNGRPLSNTQIYVLDHHRRPVPEGVMGELYIGGISVGLGYVGEAELSRQCFMDNPFGEGRLYKTGDWARWLVDGNLEFIGRQDRQVKIRGFRIELGEIEAQLTQQSGVSDAAVVLRKSQGNAERLIAWVTPSESEDGAACIVENSQQLNIEKLKETLKSTLPEHMQPSDIMELPTLPLTVSGKVDYKALPETDFTVLSDNYIAPNGETEITLAGIWKQLLSLESISSNDNFFTLGGHSLLAMRLALSIQHGLGREINIKDIFDYPVLADLALRLDAMHFITQAPIVPVNRSQPLPLSWAQQRLWFMAQLDGGNEAYHIPAMLRLSGPLSVSALDETFRTIVSRHEVLRTVFREEDGELWQTILPAGHFTLQHSDIAYLTEDMQRLAINAASEQELEKPFDLAVGPLFRGHLLRLSDSEHVLQVTMHHIVSDGWSMGILIDEINTLYRAYNDGKPNPLPPLSIQYADYAVWQRRNFTGELLAQQEAFWQQHLAGLPPLLELPTDRPRPLVQSFKGDSVEINLSKTLTNKVKSLAKSEGLTLHMFFYTAWVVVLSRLSSQDQIVVGTPVANRQRHELEGLIGFFVNTLTLRTDLSGNPTVKELLARVKNLSLAAYAHLDVPFERIVELVQPSRSLSYSPVFQVLFDLDIDADEDSLELEGLQLEGMDTESAIAQFDLSLSLLDKDDAGLEGELEFATDLFNRETVARWAAYFESIVAAFVNEIDSGIDDLDMLPESERQRLLVTFNQSENIAIQSPLIHGAFEIQAAQNPETIAAEQAGECLSYQDLNKRANQLAHYLIKQGVQPGQLVGIYLPRSIEFLIGLLGVMKAGAAFVVMDINNPKQRLQQICEGASLSTIISVRSQSTNLFNDRLYLDDAKLQTLLAQQAIDNPNILIEPEAPAFAYYTSGSTGVPKGALNSHKAVVNNMLAMARELQLTPADRVLQFAALGFDVVIEEIFPTWFSGGTVVLRDDDALLDSAQLQSLLSEKNITVCELMASYWACWVEYLREREECPPDSLRKVILGSDRVTMAAYQQWQDFAIPLVNVFGLTETACTSLVFHAEGPQDFEQFLPNGRPLANTQIYIVGHNGQPVPEGVSGELYIGGDGVGLGYVGKPELSVQYFIDNSFAEGRLYKTGDHARWLPGGILEFLGRQDRQVKIRGFRIELGEVEAQLQQHPSIKEAAVVLHDVKNAESRLIAWLVPANAATIDLQQLKTDLAEQLPTYMIPTDFFNLPSIPRTLSGKIDLKALPEPVLGAAAKKQYEAPVSETEKILAQSCQELLGLDQVGLHDNFFELGGNSLNAIKLISKLKAASYELTVAGIFEYETIAEIAAHLDQEQSRVLNPVLLNNNRDKDTRPLFLAHEISGNVFFYKPLAKALGNNFPVYGLQLIGTEISLEGLSVKRLSAEYIKAIKIVQPLGPYRLAGWSAGANIAYEIANQLLGSDEKVEFVGVIDTGRNNTSEDIVQEFDALALLTEDTKDLFGIEFDPTPLKVLVKNNSDMPLISDEALADNTSDPELIALFAQLHEAGWETEDFIEQLNAAHAVSLTAERYLPPDLPLDVHLFYTLDPDFDENNPEQLDDLQRYFGWRDLLADKLKPVLIPGDHLTMISEPHVNVLAAEIINGINAFEDCSEASQALYSPFVHIQKGKAGQTPLICIPGSADSAAVFIDLAQALGLDTPLAAIQPKGLDAQTVPHITVEHATSFYMKAIKAEYSKGPYRLLGHSFGGWVANELATRLTAEGSQVELLTVIDSQAPASQSEQQLNKTRIDYLLELIEALEQNLDRTLAITREELMELEEDKQLSRLIETTEFNMDIHTMRSIVNSFIINSETEYQPKARFFGSSLLINARQRGRERKLADEETSNMWNKYLPNLQVLDIDGNHISILKHPLIDQIAENLKNQFALLESKPDTSSGPKPV